MKEIELLMQAYEKQLNQSVSLILHADGSGEVVDFFDSNRIYFQFGSTKEMKEKLRQYSN